MSTMVNRNYLQSSFQVRAQTCQKSWLYNYHIIYRFFPLCKPAGIPPPQVFFFCKKVLTNCCFYGKIGGAMMIDARWVSILSSFFHFFRSKFQILFIFANSRKVFCIYVLIIGATLVIMRRFSQKSSKKLKKNAQFSNKIFVQFSQKYTGSALHRVKALRFTALKRYTLQC